MSSARSIGWVVVWVVAIVFLAGPGAIHAATLTRINFELSDDHIYEMGSGWMEFNVEPENFVLGEWHFMKDLIDLDVSITTWTWDGYNLESYYFDSFVNLESPSFLPEVRIRPFDEWYVADFKAVNSYFVADGSIPTPNRIYFYIENGAVARVEDPNPPGEEDEVYSTVVTSVWFDDPEPYPPVPVPGAFWLLGSGLIGLIGIKRKLAGNGTPSHG